jgi:hypothetical protein
MLGRPGAVLTAYITLVLGKLIALPPKVLKFFVKLTSSSQNKPRPSMTGVAKDLAHLHRAYHQHLLPLMNVALSGPDPGLHENGHDPNAELHTTPRLHTTPQAASIGLTRATAPSRTAPTGICS